MKLGKHHLNEPILAYAHRKFPLLHRELTVAQALDTIRKQGLEDEIIYFYAVDHDERLQGVIPARRLLTAPLEARLESLLIEKVVAIPHGVTVEMALEYFILYRYMAFPVVDENHRVVGIVDTALFTHEIVDMADRRAVEETFETIGLRVSEWRSFSPVKVFRYRFPWLLATILGGMICAGLVGFFRATIAEHLILAFFLTLVLGLGESISVQSLTITIQGLRLARPDIAQYWRKLGRELLTSLLIGGASAALVLILAAIWEGFQAPLLSIGLSIILILIMGSLVGLSVPFILHALRLDLKVAAGPVTLAMTDIGTILIYFTVAGFVLS